MTRPIYEPSLQRTDRRLGYGQDQLFRRPAPPTAEGVGAIEWILIRSTTNWGTSLTTLNFSQVNGSYDNVTPTFAINGDNNLEIAKSGAYVMWFEAFNFSFPGGSTFNRVFLDGANVSGEIPALAWYGWTPQGTFRFILDYATTWTTGGYLTDNFNSPPAQRFLNYDTDQFPGTGPSEFEFRGLYYVDAAETADTGVIVNILIYRLGEAFV